jgi:hypothetical protein
MANRVAPGFFNNMKRDLAALNRTIKEFLHHDGYENIRAMDPWNGLKNLGPDQIWGTDPVHVKTEHLGNLVRGVQISLEKLTPKKRRDSNAAAAAAGQAKRQRTERGSEGSLSGGQSQPSTGHRVCIHQKNP